MPHTSFFDSRKHIDTGVCYISETVLEFAVLLPVDPSMLDLQVCTQNVQLYPSLCFYGGILVDSMLLNVVLCTWTVIFFVTCTFMPLKFRVITDIVVLLSALIVGFGGGY